MQSAPRRVAFFLAILTWPVRPTPADQVVFRRDVRPVLAHHCFQCHGPDDKARKADLRLDLRDSAVGKQGSEPGVIVPGKPDESELVRRIFSADAKEVMPPPATRNPLSDVQKQMLKRWIAAGAEYQPHWAFVPPRRPPLPKVQRAEWPRNALDSFVLARLEAEGLRPAAPADRYTLVRRLYLDLIGLPPTPEQADSFVRDPDPNAYEKLVDRLLASPHYGERGARHWLDLARYADSHGYSLDAPREIWKYRDWVIQALNRDLPFDQFVIEQIAGDLLPDATPEQKTATGFHRNTPLNQEGGIDQEQFRVESVADRVATTGVVFLGLTVGCARCHDHKYDPITQREYFQLFAFLNNADEPILDLAAPEAVARRNAIRTQIASLEKEVNAFEDRWRRQLTPEQRGRLQPAIVAILMLSPDQRSEPQKAALLHFLAARDDRVRACAARLTELKRREPKFPTTMIMQERKRARETHLHIGGDFTRKGERVFPGVPAVLHPLPPSAKPNRLDLAKWLVDPRNPLVARVTVNRIWQHYFGRGIVETENDFGTQGALPSHPELLDWLATEFMARRWSLKAVHRLIVTSATYRQSSGLRPELSGTDPQNRFLARQTRLRLDAEIIRDSALAASGALSSKIGGPSVFPPQPEGVFRFTQVVRPWDPSSGPDRSRRGLYTTFWRSAPYPSLLVFDAPDATAACTRRIRSNTPLQALTLLNDRAFLEFAQELAARLDRELPANGGDRLRRAFRLCLSREPTAAELQRLEQFLVDQRVEFQAAPDAARALAPARASVRAGLPEAAAWVALARVLLNLDEFITRE